MSTTATGNAVTWSARYSSTASVSRSAQCISSSTTMAPRPGDSQRRTRNIASASTTGAGGTAGNAGPAAQCGTSVPSAGRYGARTGSSGGRRSRSPSSSASPSGRSGETRSVGVERPASTACPRSRARIGRLGDQPGLAHPRLASDNNADPGPARRLAEDLRQRGQLPIPADNDGTPHNRIVARAPAQKASAAHSQSAACHAALPADRSSSRHFGGCAVILPAPTRLASPTTASRQGRVE